MLDIKSLLFHESSGAAAGAAVAARAPAPPESTPHEQQEPSVTRLATIGNAEFQFNVCRDEHAVYLQCDDAEAWKSLAFCEWDGEEFAILLPAESGLAKINKLSIRKSVRLLNEGKALCLLFHV